MPLQATSGAASYDAFGGGVPVVPNYIEDVFSNYLWTGNSSSQTITNGIDLSTKGGMVWIKARSSAIENVLLDTTRGIGNYLVSNNTDQQIFVGNILTSVLTNGFDIGSSARANSSGVTYASWTFREQPKFFDVVTYTGDGTNRTIAHNLGSVPGCIIVKCTSTSSDWITYHSSVGNTQVLKLNTTAAAGTDATAWNSTTPTSTVFSLGTGPTNNAGETYVAYLYASNAGGFGLLGTDNVISCGTYTGTGTAGLVVTLGYEPQWVLIKKTSSFGDWWLVDNMRGMPVGSANAYLYPNSSAAEATATVISPTATGFTVDAVSGALNGTGATYIYIAIRRGPMKVPTSGTSVFDVDAYTGNGATDRFIDSGFTDDFFFFKNRTAVNNWFSFDRLRGNGNYLNLNSTSGEGDLGDAWVKFTKTQTGILTGDPGYGDINFSGLTNVAYHFKRAPSFFDEICYTGTGSARTVAHNLTVAPELMIVKKRSAADDWPCYFASLGATTYVHLNRDERDGGDSGTFWNSTAPTASVFSVATDAKVNGSGTTYVAYLFATCAGVSKVGTYTGTGTTKQIDCGFTSGARFVLIKRTSTAPSNWYVWDTARGIVSGNDPYLLLNSTAAEVTNTDYIDTYSAGFEISSTAPAAINASGGTFVFLAIA